MKRALLLALTTSLILAACQAATSTRPPAETLRQQSAPSSAGFKSLNLPLSNELRQQLQQPEDESDPRDEVYNEALVAQIMDPRYVHAHSFYFDHLDGGSSTVETILNHDGHTRAAGLLVHWRSVLSAGSVWPDRNSTTYRGRFTALEHGQVGPNKGWFTFANARTKAQEYYNLALKAWHRDLPPDADAQSEAWSWLGRTSHFLQDMSVPFHTRSLVRPAQALRHHPYEISCEDKFDDYLPSRNHNAYGVWAGGGPYPASGPWGLYYPAGTSADAMIMQLAEQSAPFYKLANHAADASNGNWEKTRTVLIPLGAKLTSGLVVNFLQDVGVANP